MALIREVVGVFGDMKSMRTAADELMISGFDRADLSLLSRQKKALRRMLALVQVFNLPVPLPAVQAVAGEDEVEAHRDRAVALGLLEAGVDPVERQQRYLVSKVLAPLLANEINEEERKAACGAGARALFALWVSERTDGD